MNRIAKKSKLTEEDVRIIADKINKSAWKEFSKNIKNRINDKNARRG